MRFEEWNNFNSGSWEHEVNVRDFIQKNYTPYEGDESFLCGPTERTQKSMEKLNALVGGYVNLEYTLPNGSTAKFLNDSATYLGNQLESETGDRCFGIAANADFILICTYEQDGANPELVIYKKR